MSEDLSRESSDNGISSKSFNLPISPKVDEKPFILETKRARLDECRSFYRKDAPEGGRHSLNSAELSDWTKGQSSCTDRFAKLSAIVEKCSHDELVHLSKTIEPLLKRDFLLHLPIELSLYILSYLSLKDILRCAQVSSSWRRITSDPLLWYRLCKRDGITDLRSLLANERRLLHVTPTALDISEPATTAALYVSQRDWKTVYRQDLETRCNWLHGSPLPPIVLCAHHNHVITCLEVFNDWAISGSDDSSICVWSLTRGELIINLFGHIGGVWSLAVLPSCNSDSPPLLVSGSCDRTARVWSLDGSHFPCLTTLCGHQSTVRCLAGQRQDPREADIFLDVEKPVGKSTCGESSALLEQQQLVVTGSRDTTLRLWNALSGRCLRVFKGHRGAVRCVQFCGFTIVSGSYDCTVRVWCSQTGDCLRALNAHRNRVYTLLFDGLRIISASLDTTICVWDVRTGHLKHTFCGHQSLTSEMAYGRTQRILVSSNADETIRVWDVETGECLHVLAGRHKHQSAVTCVQLTRHFIVSSGDDGTVKLWDRRTGSYIRDLVRLDGAGRGGVIWRIVSSDSRLVCAAGSRNGSETTKLIILSFDEQSAQSNHSLPHLCRSKFTSTPTLNMSEPVGVHH